MATYSAVIDLRVGGLKQVEQVEKAVKNIQKELKATPSLFDKRTGNANVKKAKEELSEYVIQAGKGNTAIAKFSTTLAGLNSQVRAFNAVAANASTGSDEFTAALQAAERGSIKLKQAEIARLNVQNQFYTPKGPGRSTNVAEILSLGKTIPKSITGLELYQRELTETLRIVDIGSKDFTDLSLAIAEVNEQLARAQNLNRLQGPQVPGAEGGPSSPLSAKPKNTRFFRSTKFRDIATGAGFPLLFGGGPAQALAGGIGGAFGGLGGSIAASAIAAQFEAFGVAAAQAGQALNSTGGALDFVREKSLFSTAEAKERAAVLEEQGRVEELATLLTQELVDKIGNKGVKSLQELGKTTDETTRLWNELTLQLFRLVSGPLNAFLKVVNKVLGRVVGDASFNAFLQDLEPAQRALAEARVKELQGRVGTGRSAAKSAKLSEQEAQAIVRKEFAGQRKLDPNLIPVTPEDRRRFAVKDRAGEKAAREEARIQQKLAALEVERQKILEISQFKDKIAAAEAINDTQTAIRLKGEQELAAIEANRLTDLTKATDQRLKDSINITAATKKLAAQREIERQLNEDQRKRQELFEDTLAGLENQLAIQTAVTREEAEQLRIKQEMRDLDDKGFSPEQLGRIKAAKERLSEAQQPLNKFITDSTRALNDVEQVGVTVAQGIGNAFGTAMTTGVASLIEGTKKAEEVFADFLKNIANALLDTAAQMIATYIAIGIAKAFAGLASGGDGASSVPSTAYGDLSVAGPDFFSGGMIPGFAEGGYVSSPTRAIIAEGGEPEFVIPESKMRESMARYSRGARGSSVIPSQAGGGDSEMFSGTAVAAPIDVRYTVERINSVDYVTADQFQLGMQRAAQQGAAEGERRTLRSLKNSPGTRRGVGM